MISTTLRRALVFQRTLTVTPARRIFSIPRLQSAAARSPSGTLSNMSIFGNSRHSLTHFHTSPQRQAIWLANPYLYRIAAFVTGRLMKRWWNRLPVQTRKKYISRFTKSGDWIFIGTLGLFGATAAFYAYHLEEAPFSHRRRLMLVDQKEMRAIGDFLFNADMEMFQERVLPDSDPNYIRVRAVAVKLLEANWCQEVADVSWKIVIVDDPAINAYVMPSGQIVVFTGMLELMKTDDMLAAILGHEMAHAIMGHMGENASREQFINFFSLIIVTLVWFVLPDVTAFFTQWIEKKLFDILMKLPYSRKLEGEADVVGLRLAARACYDVRESSILWETLAIAEGDEQPVEWLSTHPAHETRAGYLEMIIPDFVEYRRACNCDELTERDMQAFKKTVCRWVLEKRREQREQRGIAD